jgi:hypothetical protein
MFHLAPGVIMTRSRILWLSLFAAAALWSAECQVTPYNTTFKATDIKEYCTESLDTFGCNAGRISMTLQGNSECRENQEINAACSIALWMKTRRHPRGIGETLHTNTAVTFTDGMAEAAKEYVSWSRLVDPVSDLQVLSVNCSVEPSKETAHSEDAAEEDDAALHRYELEMLKEQNRAKELEIEALKLKIKLKALESEATR